MQIYFENGLYLQPDRFVLVNCRILIVSAENRSTDLVNCVYVFNEMYYLSGNYSQSGRLLYLPSCMQTSRYAHGLIRKKTTWQNYESDCGRSSCMSLQSTKALFGILLTFHFTCNCLRNIGSISSHAANVGAVHTVHKPQSNEVQSRHCGDDSPLMNRPAFCIHHGR